MPGAAAFFAAFLAAFGNPAAHATAARTAVVAKTPHVRIAVAAAPRSSRVHSCSTTKAQPTATGRKVLPVACEQPPRSNLTLPNAATGGLSALLGGGR